MSRRSLKKFLNYINKVWFPWALSSMNLLTSWTKRIIRSRFIKKYRYIILIFLFLGSLYYFSLPSELFKDPTCTVITSRKGKLLGALIAGDNQWRFPSNGKVPQKFEQSLLTFEDRYFKFHPGINPVSIARALIQNIRNKRIVSGGSTISMQVIRLSRKGKKRTIKEKIIEMLLATRMELSFTKDEILSMYASHAPFGGNIVGINAASWRYFGIPPSNLSWGEAATLAVLPNTPSLVFPGKQQEVLMEKRNRLLNQLFEQGTIDKSTCYLAKLEPLPGRPRPLPREAPHLLVSLHKIRKGEYIRTTIDAALQKQVNYFVKSRAEVLKHNGIHNAAAIVIKVETGEVVAYVGNTPALHDENHGNDVDIITSPRSTGSILKPLLFGLMLDDGKLLSTALVPDIPSYISGFMPQNFNYSYDGAVPAKKALSRSLNIPAVLMLRDFSVPKFHECLKNFGITTFQKPSSHYGLSMILGGGEGTLLEISGVYAGLSRTLKHFNDFDGAYFHDEFRLPKITLDILPGETHKKTLSGKKNLSAGAIWLTYQALLEVNRPETEEGWQFFNSSKEIAWKTGTSFGFKDAWSIGTTPNYVVATWAGNADGEGRPGLIGSKAAAPLMFEIFSFLPHSRWFDMPFDELIEVPICRESGYKPSINCNNIDTTWAILPGLRTSACPFHKIVHLDSTGSFQVTGECYPPNFMKHQPWFILPPVQELYYLEKNPVYKKLPPFFPGCPREEQSKPMELIYPSTRSKIFVPVDLDGKKSKVVFEAAHRDPGKIIFWHLDNKFIGQTTSIHQMAVSPSIGKHDLTLVDEDGAIISTTFEIINK